MTQMNQSSQMNRRNQGNPEDPPIPAFLPPFDPNCAASTYHALKHEHTQLSPYLTDLRTRITGQNLKVSTALATHEAARNAETPNRPTRDVRRGLRMRWLDAAHRLQAWEREEKVVVRRLKWIDAKTESLRKQDASARRIWTEQQQRMVQMTQEQQSITHQQQMAQQQWDAHQQQIAHQQWHAQQLLIAHQQWIAQQQRAIQHQWPIQHQHSVVQSYYYYAGPSQQPTEFRPLPCPPLPPYGHTYDTNVQLQEQRQQQTGAYIHSDEHCANGEPSTSNGVGYCNGSSAGQYVSQDQQHPVTYMDSNGYHTNGGPSTSNGVGLTNGSSSAQQGGQVPHVPQQENNQASDHQQHHPTTQHNQNLFPQTPHNAGLSNRFTAQQRLLTTPPTSPSLSPSPSRSPSPSPSAREMRSSSAPPCL